MRRVRFELLALVGAIVAFFWPLFTGRYAIPRAGGDLASFLWPTWRFAARALQQGTLPLWNPYLYAGMPFLADNQSALLYPVNLLVFLIGGEPGYATMTVLVVAHLVLVGGLMVLLLREYGLGPWPAAFGGLAFALSDLFITHLGNLNLNATIAYLPGVLWCAERAYARRAWGWALTGGALLAVAALAGHGQMLAFLALTLLVVGGYRAVLALREGPAASARVVGLTAAIALVGVLGAAASLWPSYELVGHTMRQALTIEEASRYALPWRGLVGLVVPGFHGRGAHAFWGSWDRVEVGYLGVLPLVLGLVGLLPLGRKASQRGQRFPVVLFGALTLLGLLLAVGDRTPLYGLLHGAPLLRGMRAPARFVALLSFGLAALGAYALDLLPDSVTRRRLTAVGLTLGLALALALPRVVPVPPDRAAAAIGGSQLAALLCALGLGWLGAGQIHARLGRRWIEIGAVTILALDLIASGSTLEIDPGDPSEGYRHSEVVAYLREQPEPYRIDSSSARAWQPDAAAVHSLRDVGGVHNPLGLAAYETYRWSIGQRGDLLYNMLGVRYVLANKGEPPGDERLQLAYASAPEIDVYINTAAYPMAWLVYEAREVGDAGEAFAAIHAEGYDPARTVVLHTPPRPLSDTAAAGRVTYLEHSPNRLRLMVETPAPAYLVLSEVDYPGWRAAVGETPATVLRANYLFRAVYVPAGQHEVRIWFQPESVTWGLAISLVTWAGLVAWAGRRWIGRRRAGRGAQSAGVSSS